MTHTSLGFCFPGRWVGGVSLIVGPLVLLAGVLLRTQFHFFFPQQLAAYRDHPDLISAAYSCVLAGNLLLFPGILALANRIGVTRPGWALAGGLFVLFGLFARIFHAGVDHLAFQLVRVEGLEAATRAIAGSYGAFHIVQALNGAILFGWIILAAGSYLSGVLSLVRSIALALMSALMIGVLKGTSPVSIVSVSGLVIALVPLGIELVREPPRPGARTVIAWSAAVVGLIGAFTWLGTQG